MGKTTCSVLSNVSSKPAMAFSHHPDMHQEDQRKTVHSGHIFNDILEQPRSGYAPAARQGWSVRSRP